MSLSPRATRRTSPPALRRRPRPYTFSEIIGLLQSGEVIDFEAAILNLTREQLEGLVSHAIRHRGLRAARGVARAIFEYRNISIWLTTLVKHCLHAYNEDLDAAEDTMCGQVIDALQRERRPLPTHGVNADQIQEALERDAREALDLLARSEPTGLGALLARRILTYAGLSWAENLPNTPAWNELRRRTRNPLSLLYEQNKLRKGNRALRSLFLTQASGFNSLG